MKYLFVLTLLSISSISYSYDQIPPYPLQSCISHAPYGFPETSKQGISICRAGYVTLSDISAKLPIWVSYKLTPSTANGCIPRSNSFSSDQSLPKGSRAELSDFKGSGFDMGHMSPADDQSSIVQTERESFILSNISPQLANLNRGSWKLLETSIRGWVLQRNHPYVIYTGSIYDSSDKTIGSNKVVVPHAFYKIVIDTVSNETAGFLFPHQNSSDYNLLIFRKPIHQIQEISGINFGFSQNTIELPINQLWPVDFGYLTKFKAASCNISIK